MQSLNVRQIQLIHYVQSRTNEAKIDTIADYFDVSSKTIYNDIEAINSVIISEGSEIIRTSNGIRLIIGNEKKLQEILERLYFEFCGRFFSEQYDGQYLFILKYLLFSKNRISSNEIMNKMFISESLLYKLQKHISSDLKEYGLILDNVRNQGFTISGNEEKKREFYVRKILEKCNSFPRNIVNELIAIILPYYKRVEETAKEVLSYHKYYLSDNSLKILLIYVSTAIERMKNGFELVDNFEITNKAHDHKKTNHIVEDIMKPFQNEFDLKYKKIEEDFIVVLILNNTEILYPYSANVSVHEIVEDALLGIKNKYYIDLRKNIKYVELLEAEILRVTDKKINISLYDKSNDVFKKANPYEHILAYYFYDILKNKWGIKLSSEGRSYVAVLLSACLINENPLMKKTKILLVTSSNYSYAILIKEYYKRYVGEFEAFDIIGTNDIYDEIKNADYSLILTTEVDYHIENKDAIYIGNIEKDDYDYNKFEIIKYAQCGFAKPNMVLSCFCEDNCFFNELLIQNITKDGLRKIIDDRYGTNLDNIAYINNHCIIFNNFIKERKISVKVFVESKNMIVDSIHEVNVIYIISYNPKIINMFYVLRVFDFLVAEEKKISSTSNYSELVSFVQSYLEDNDNK